MTPAIVYRHLSIIAFLDEQVVLLDGRLPTAQVEKAEPICRTVRRELYEQTGALLSATRILAGRNDIALYVALCHSPIESPVRTTVKRVTMTPPGVLNRLELQWGKNLGARCERVLRELERSAFDCPMDSTAFGTAQRWRWCPRRRR